jgi:hypothetical protein
LYIQRPFFLLICPLGKVALSRSHGGRRLPGGGAPAAGAPNPVALFVAGPRAPFSATGRKPDGTVRDKEGPRPELRKLKKAPGPGLVSFKLFAPSLQHLLGTVVCYGGLVHRTRLNLCQV